MRQRLMCRMSSPLQSTCFSLLLCLFLLICRPGRNAWVAQQWQQQQQYAQQRQHQRGYTVAGQPPLLVHPWSDFDPSESFGQRSGRCSRCPHPALAWLGFLLARVVDLLLVGLLAVLWMIFGWLTTSPAAGALDALKETKSKDMRLRLGMMSFKGSLTESFKRSGGSATAGKQQQKQQPAGSNTSDVVKLSSKDVDQDHSHTSTGKVTPAVLRKFSRGSSGCHGLLPAAAHPSSPTCDSGYDTADDHTGSSPFAVVRRASSRFGVALLTPLASIRSSRSGSGSIRTASVTSHTPSTLRVGSNTSVGSSRLPPVVSGSHVLNRTLTGFYNVSGVSSMRWSSAVSLINNLQHNHKTTDQAGDKGKTCEVCIGSL